MDCRKFLCKTAAASGLVARNAIPDHLFAATTKKLAMGAGTNSAGGSYNQSKKPGLRGVAELFRAGSRNKVIILSKTANVDRFRGELNIDYTGILLLHAMPDANWPDRKKDAMAVISEAQPNGIVRTHGTSCHTMEARRTSSKHPSVEGDLTRIHPAQVAMDAGPFKAAGKGVTGMKIPGAGRLRNEAGKCLQFALSLDCVDWFTIGGESRTEMEDLLSKIPAAGVRG